MKQLGLAVLCWIGFSITPALATPLRALVYRGPGACAEDCAESAAQVAQSLGIQTRFVGPRDIRPAIFEGVQFWIQPGGNAIQVSKALAPHQIALIRDFVRLGGGYVGFCAGAFFADSVVDDDGKVKGLGILPVGTKDLDVDSRENGILLPILWRGIGRRDVYFYGGASFLPPAPGASLEVLAIYGNREIAALHAPFGLGKVAVAGFHPEAPDHWKKLTGMRDPDGSDWDLAVQMLKLTLPARGFSVGR